VSCRLDHSEQDEHGEHASPKQPTSRSIVGQLWQTSTKNCLKAAYKAKYLFATFIAMGSAEAVRAPFSFAASRTSSGTSSVLRGLYTVFASSLESSGPVVYLTALALRALKVTFKPVKPPFLFAV
jgi:hypothetical protein